MGSGGGGSAPATKTTTLKPKKHPKVDELPQDAPITRDQRDVEPTAVPSALLADDKAEREEANRKLLG